MTETVFSHPSKIDLLRVALAAGYLVSLELVAVPVELAVARVRSRVAAGGHDVPEDKVRSRHARLWVHVADAIAIAHESHVYANTSAADAFRLVATFQFGHLVGDPDWPAWMAEEIRQA